MSHAHEIRPAARDDIEAAYHWYEAQQMGRGDEFLADFDRQLAAVCAAPELYGRVLGEVRAAPLSSSRYVLYYRIDGGQVTVLAVQHERADPRRWRRRK